MPVNSTLQTSSASQTFDEARADQLVETTWTMVKALAFGSLIFLTFEAAIGEIRTELISIFCFQTFLVAWVLYQKRWYVIARYYIFLGATIALIMLSAMFGTESYSYFLMCPLLLGIFASFHSAKERFGLSALVLSLAVSLIHFGVLDDYVTPIESPEGYQTVFILLTMILCYYVTGRLLEVNRDFMVRAKGITHVLKKQELALHKEFLKEELQTSQFQLANRKLELEMNQRILMERKLSSSNEQLSQFSFAASHDLKEPLRSISSFIGIIQKKIAGINDAALEERTGEVIESASKMSKLLDDLLLFSNAGKYKHTSEPVDLNQTLNACFASLEPSLKDCKIEVSTMPVVMADKKAMHVLFMQVIKNAIMFACDLRPLSLKVSSKEHVDGMVEILVKDNGKGIKIGAREDVFRLFCKEGDCNGKEGSGVGLAISRKIVHSFGGSIQFISNKNQEGITLTFTLPVLP
jgi:signal transduction histidine kinase